MKASVPTIITFFRLFLGPAFIYLHSIGVRVEWLFGLVVLSFFTDWLDGYLARRWNAITTLGKLLDPFADALFCMLVFVDFARHGLVPAWIVVILICREALMTFALRPIAFQRGIVVAARYTGKVKTGIQFTTILVVLWSLLPWPGGVVDYIRILIWMGMLIVLFFSIVSVTQYGIDIGMALVRRRRAPEGQEG